MKLRKLRQVFACTVIAASLAAFGALLASEVLRIFWYIESIPLVRWTAELVYPTCLLIATLWLWRFWVQPRQRQWSRGKAVAAGVIVGVCVHRVTRIVCGILLFAVLGFEYSLGGSRSDGMAIAAGVYVVPIGLAMSVGAVAYRRLRSIKPDGHCRHCGYDLTGNESGVCPECGVPA